MLKKVSSIKLGTLFTRRLLAVAALLFFAITLLTSITPVSVWAESKPQLYTSPKQFGEGYGFIIIDSDHILLVQNENTSFFKEREVMFTRGEEETAKNLTPDDTYEYTGSVTFTEGDLNRNYIMYVDKKLVDANKMTDTAANPDPIPIEQVLYGTPSGNGQNLKTNASSNSFKDVAGTSRGWLFYDNTIAQEERKKIADAEAAASDKDKKDATEGLECETSLLNPLTWIVCPIIATANQAVILLDNAITTQMTINTDEFLGNNTNGNGFFAAWSSFRFIGLTLLVIIAMVMIFSEALSIDAFDAYTVRKVLPRLLIAIIFITLSWSLCKYAIEITNDLGQGVGALINAPFADIPDVSISGGTSTLTFVGGAIAAASLGLIGTLTFGLTALLAVFTAFFVLVMRKMVILLLIIIAPIAIVASVLPNTQRFWKMWWDFFIKALLAFPIIMLFIASGRVFAKVVAQSETGTPDLIKQFIAFVAYFLPYFLLPTAFKLAGGAVGAISGMVNDRTKGLSAGIGKYRQNSAARHREHQGRRVVASRAKWASNLQDASSDKNRNALSRLALRSASKGIGGYNIQAQASARQAAVAKELNDQINTGRDEEIRGLTVNKLAAQRAGALVKDADGHMSNGLMRINSDTNLREYKTLGGAWVSEGAVDAGRSRWKNDVYAQQAALSYEMRKAATDEQVQGVAERYKTLATGPGGWNMSEGQATGALKGAGFENQNTHLEFKHMKLDGSMNYKAFAEEAYEKKGSYPLSQMSAHTIQRLSEAYDNGDQQTKDQVAAIAETFVSRYGGANGQTQLDPQGNVIAPSPQGPQAAGVMPGGTDGVVQTNTPGAAHVAEEVRKLAVKTGAYSKTPGGPDTKPTVPPPAIPRQN